MLCLGTAKCNLSQVKWPSQVNLQWLPDTDGFPAFHTAAHLPAAVPAAQEAKGGGVQRSRVTSGYLDVPDSCSLKHQARGWVVVGTRDLAESRTDVWSQLTGSQMGNPTHSLSEDVPEGIPCCKTCCLGLIGSLQGKSAPLKIFQLIL